MKYIYSANKNAFYPVELKESYMNAGSWPSDGIEVAAEVFNEFALQETPEGKLRIPGNNGLPAWSDIPPPDQEELIIAAELIRQQLLAHADATMLDWRTELMLGDISDSNKTKLMAWLAYKNQVKSTDIETTPEHVDWPALP